MLLLVHPRYIFFLVYERKHLEEKKKKNQKAFVVCIYIMNKDEERQMCKSDSMQAVAYVA